jgi:hypothetical protein
MSKLPFDISEIQKKCMVGIDNINLEINKLWYYTYVILINI